MQMPSVDLDELGGQLEAMQHHQQEQVTFFPLLFFSVQLTHSSCNAVHT